MNVNNFQRFLMKCYNFVDKMNKNNIPITHQRVMLKCYIKSYNINHNAKIKPTEYNITELVS